MVRRTWSANHGPKTMARRPFTEGSQKVHREFTEGSQKVHRGFTKGSQRVHRRFTEGAQRVHRGFTEDSQRVHRGFTESSQRIHRGFTGGSQKVHRVFTEGSQRVHKRFTEGSQRVHRGFTESAQRVHRRFTEQLVGFWATSGPPKAPTADLLSSTSLFWTSFLKLGTTFCCFLFELFFDLASRSLRTQCWVSSDSKSNVLLRRGIKKQLVQRFSKKCRSRENMCQNDPTNLSPNDFSGNVKSDEF